MEKSFNRPVRVSKHIILSPPHRSYEAHINDIIVFIQPGSSFGTGEHPTTRLALRGIEHAFSYLTNEKNIYSLDIGTGSGILAIASVKLGISNSWGIDIDQCAVYEARQNVVLNNLEHNILINNTSLDAISNKFGLITANLRAPTLKLISPKLKEILKPGGFAVFSGIKIDEYNKVLDYYTDHQFKMIKHENEHGWASLVLRV
ncbi:ribosomal protein L11 methyltransferase [Candidatus Magnetomoraceae bacterium gMMP-15]